MLVQGMLFPLLQHGMLAFKQNFKEIKAKACYSPPPPDLKKKTWPTLLSPHTPIIVYNTLHITWAQKNYLLLLLGSAHS